MTCLVIAGVRIDGVAHECSEVLNLKEDILQVILNLRHIVLKGSLNKPVIVKVNYQGPGIITAQDIALPKGIEVVRSESMCYPYIATVTSDQTLTMELLIKKGRPFFSRVKCGSVGFIETGAVSMPVERVNFFVESATSNQVFEDFETLVLEVSTDGSVDPVNAVRKALSKLRVRINFFGNFVLRQLLGESQLLELESQLLEQDCALFLLESLASNETT
jgi:DNA-directed RNA polymerase subunit alpha